MAWPAIAARLAAWTAGNPQVGQAVKGAIGQSKNNLGQMDEAVNEFYSRSAASASKGVGEIDQTEIDRAAHYQGATRRQDRLKELGQDRLDLGGVGRISKAFEKPEGLASESGLRGAAGKGI